MKRTKSSPAKRARMHSPKHRAKRPIHKRVLLHPITVFLLLCVGVLVAGSSFRSQAESYDVTATVPGVTLAQPARITSPVDQQHLITSSTKVSGGCPDDSYVKLYRDAAFSGVAVCQDGSFAITTTLSLGANQLVARVYNLTDQEGPASLPITVYYDRQVATSAPITPPTTLKISGVEQGGYSPGIVQEVGNNPTIRGLAPPFSDITVTFYSIPSVCQTKANAQGVWSCTLATSLAAGTHHVVVTATTPAGKTFTFPTFEIKVAAYKQSFALTSDYTYKAYQEGQTYNWKVGLIGGSAPYNVRIDWGDGSTSTLRREDTSQFTLSHLYNSPALSQQSYTVLVSASDARGATAMLQLTATIQGTAVPVRADNSLFGSVTATVQRWLWVVWPVYIGVVLMGLSFWIGEREAYQRFLARRRVSHR